LVLLALTACLHFFITFNHQQVVKSIGAQTNIAPEIGIQKNMLMRSFRGFDLKPAADYVESRVPVLVNSDVYLELAAPSQSMKDYFYKNADADEIIFIL